MAYEDTFRSIKVKDRIKTTNLDVVTIAATGDIGGVTVSAVNIKNGFVQYTATATNTVNSGFIGLAHASTPIVISVPAPGMAGKFLVIRDNSASGTAAHVVTSTGGTFDGTNNTATFDAPGEQLILYSISATAWIILLNSGSVGMSSV